MEDHRGGDHRLLSRCQVVDVEFTVQAREYTWLGAGLRRLGLLPPVAYLAGRAGGCRMRARFYWVPLLASDDGPAASATNVEHAWSLALQETYYEVNTTALLWPFYTLFWLALTVLLGGRWLLHAVVAVLSALLPAGVYQRWVMAGALNRVQPVRVFPQERAPDALLSTCKSVLGSLVTGVLLGVRGGAGVRRGGRGSAGSVGGGRVGVDRQTAEEWAALSPSPLRAGKVRPAVGSNKVE